MTFLDAFGELSKNHAVEDSGSDDSEVEDETMSPMTVGEHSQIDEELSLTGVALGRIVLEEMKKMNLNLKLCTSIGTDACAVMLSDIGAVNEIRKEAKNAAVTPCYSHKLNSSISKSVRVRLIEMVCNTIREVDKFFKNTYPKRSTALGKILGEQLIQLCETRWVQRHDAVIQFAAKLSLIIKALKKISDWKNKETAGKATILIAAVCKFEFIVGLFCLCDILSLTHTLSVILQKESIDLAKASNMIDTLLLTFRNRRQKAEENFRSIYSDTKKMAVELEVDEEKPRICGRQTKRENFSVSTCEDYYRVSVYIPLLDTISEDLKTRFSREVLDGFQLSLLLPEKVCALKTNEMENLIDCLIDRFRGLLDNDNIVRRLKLKGELDHWQCYWGQKQKSKDNKLPTTALETLKNCDVDLYPIIHSYLRIFCTLPVTNASSERSFSTLRRMKTWLRTTMLQDRLIGLALLHTHHDIEVTAEEVLERFSKLGPHRLVL